jgi:hypothetical protein
MLPEIFDKHEQAEKEHRNRQRLKKMGGKKSRKNDNADNKNVNPILKRNKGESKNEFDIPRKERHSKSVQIESDDQIFGE